MDITGGSVPENEEDYGGARPPTFSQRYGYTPYPTAIQHQGLDERSRLDIWNLIDPLLLYQERSSQRPIIKQEIVWSEYLGEIRSGYREPNYRVKLQNIVFAGPWFGVYDLLQAIIQLVDEQYRRPLADAINKVLKLNRAGCRVVGNLIVEITDEAEIKEVEQALRASSSASQVHLKNAIALLANRDDTQFAKSIGESISAAEAAARELSGDPSATLADALKSVARKGTAPGFHRALIDGWISMYGFTSDDGGIRHALKEGTVPPSQELAQYFVVTCSAFVNFVTALKAE